MTALLICPAGRSGMRLLAGKRPLALAHGLGRTLLDLALADLSARGFIRVRVLAEDRPEMVRASVGRGETRGLQVELPPETRESSVAGAGGKYPNINPSHIQILDYLSGNPNLRLFDSRRDWMHTLGTALSVVTTDRVGMQESPSGVCVERGVQIGRNAKLIAPCWIGAYVWVGAGATLGPRAVIEAGCCVEHEVEVTESLIGPDTDVGACTEVPRSLAWGSRLQSWENGSTTTVPDRFLLDDLTEGSHGSTGPGFPARAAALVALVLTAPLVVWAWIRHRRAEGPLLRTRPAVRAPLPADGRTEVITYRELAGLQGIGRRWLALWKIGGGRFARVGNRPQSPVPGTGGHPAGRLRASLALRAVRHDFPRRTGAMGRSNGQSRVHSSVTKPIAGGPSLRRSNGYPNPSPLQFLRGPARLARRPAPRRPFPPPPLPDSRSRSILNPSSTMKLQTLGNSLLAGCPAELTASNAAVFREQTRAAVSAQHQHVEFDMSQTNFLDSSGLGALISIHKLMCIRGGSVRIRNPSPTVLQILELTRMHRIFEIIPA